MNEGGYLDRLAARLILGLAEAPEEVRARQAAYLCRSQNADGGFSGREGPSDLYYTGFALRSLAVLGELSEDVGQRAADFLRRSVQQRASVVDFFSWLYSCRLLQVLRGLGEGDVLAEAAAGWEDRTAAELHTFRTPDGGYAKVPGGTSGSTYHSFLVALCHELIERPLPEPHGVLAFVESRRRDDGGFVELGVMKRSGTNPTAAAVALLQILGEEERLRQDQAVVKLIAGMASPEGGLRANSRVPLADLLSTFTGLWTLHELEALERVDLAKARRFAESLEHPEGGFRAGLWDERTDVEYTFYGLGTLALTVSA